MIPELGKYAVSVLSSYGLAVVLLLGVVGVSWLQGRRVKQQLEEVEARQDKSNG